MGLLASYFLLPVRSLHVYSGFLAKQKALPLVSISPGVELHNPLCVSFVISLFLYHYTGACNGYTLILFSTILGLGVGLVLGCGLHVGYMWDH